MTKLQELILSGGSRHGTHFIPHKVEPVKEQSGCCIKSAHGWRTLKPTVSHTQYKQEDQKPWDINYNKYNDPKFNPSLRTNSSVSEDGRYREGFVFRDNLHWTHKAWAFYQELHRERVAMTAARINRRGHDKMKVPPLSTAGRFDKFGVKVMS